MNQRIAYQKVTQMIIKDSTKLKKMQTNFSFPDGNWYKQRSFNYLDMEVYVKL